MFPWKRGVDVDSRASRGGGGGVHVCLSPSLPISNPDSISEEIDDTEVY